jgi:DNA-directed RNA polymerase specialized sigma24 family protein
LRNPAEAEDVLQEVFLRVWRSPEQLKIGKNLLPWMAVVSRNSSIDIIRKRRPSESIEDVTLASPSDTCGSPKFHLTGTHCVFHEIANSPLEL